MKVADSWEAVTALWQCRVGGNDSRSCSSLSVTASGSYGYQAYRGHVKGQLANFYEQKLFRTKS